MAPISFRRPEARHAELSAEDLAPVLSPLAGPAPRRWAPAPTPFHRPGGATSGPDALLRGRYRLERHARGAVLITIPNVPEGCAHGFIEQIVAMNPEAGPVCREVRRIAGGPEGRAAFLLEEGRFYRIQEKRPSWEEGRFVTVRDGGLRELPLREVFAALDPEQRRPRVDRHTRR